MISDYINVEIMQVWGMGGSPQLPTRGHPNDAGWDLYTSREVIASPGDTVDIHTDIRVGIPQGWYGHIHARSSTYSRHGLIILGGIIDSGYRGELFILAFNPGPASVVVEMGTRLAQVLFYPVPTVNWMHVSQLSYGDRGEGAFGSTGR